MGHGVGDGIAATGEPGPCTDTPSLCHSGVLLSTPQFPQKNEAVG